MRLHVIDAGTFKVDGGAMFGVVPKVLWGKLVASDSDNLTSWALRCLLVETAGRRVLIDAGIGSKQGERFRRRYHVDGPADMGEALRAAGFAPDDVTDVLFTHLHFDHVGGAVREDAGECVPVFANATYWVTEAQWQAAVSPNARERASFLRENFLPLEAAGQLRFWDPKVAGFDGIDALISDGHTAGQLIPRVRCGQRTVVFAADLIPSRWHVPLPYIMAYDIHPVRLLEEKAALLQDAADNDHILFFEHDPDVECCTLEHTEKGIRVKKAFALSEAGC
jgi:glyoxylase-like metal-dependent hydrolase (beta-lactamase superfamily II)